MLKKKKILVLISFFIMLFVKLSYFFFLFSEIENYYSFLIFIKRSGV